MITQTINNALIDALREKVPPGINMAGFLMDTLYLGKEAVYRRLRNEVPFTLAEAATISRKLGVSLDKTLGSAFKGSALFNLNMVHHGNPIETYYSILEGYAKKFKRIRNLTGSELGTSSNTIPQTFYLKYDVLARFQLFKWMYQHGDVELTKSFEELELPGKLPQCQNEFVSAAQQIESSCHILDKMVFLNLVNDIKYFAEMHLLTDQSVRQLREELLHLLDEMEDIAGNGRFANGNKVQIFISNIQLEATYSYVKSEALHETLIRVYSINSITSQDSELITSLKCWIHSLKKFSTLISENGEMQRIAFFARQREYIDTL